MLQRELNRHLFNLIYLLSVLKYIEIYNTNKQTFLKNFEYMFEVKLPGLIILFP